MKGMCNLPFFCVPVVSVSFVSLCNRKNEMKCCMVRNELKVSNAVDQEIPTTRLSLLCFASMLLTSLCFMSDFGGVVRKRRSAFVRAAARSFESCGPSEATVRAAAGGAKEAAREGRGGGEVAAASWTRLPLYCRYVGVFVGDGWWFCGRVVVAVSMG